MFVTEGLYNGNKMIVIKKTEEQEYGDFQSGSRKFLPILIALTECPEDVLRTIETIGGEKGVAAVKAFREKYNIPSLTANPPAPTKKPKAKKEKV